MDLDRLEKTCQEATKGPWDYDARYCRAYVNDGSNPNLKPAHIPKGKCIYCNDKEGIFVREYQENGHTCHVHKFFRGNNDYTEGWHFICSSDGTPITGNYDYEEGGICSTEEDARFIAEARTALPLLIAKVRQAEKIAEIAKEICTRNKPAPYDDRWTAVHNYDLNMLKKALAEWEGKKDGNK